MSALPKRDLFWDGVSVQVDVLRRAADGDVVNVHDVLGPEGGEAVGRRRRGCRQSGGSWRITME